MDRETVRNLLFIIDTVFTESAIPALSEVVEAAEHAFERCPCTTTRTTTRVPARVCYDGSGATVTVPSIWSARDARAT